VTTIRFLSTDIRKQLGTEQMVEEIQEYQRKSHNHVERMPPEHFQQQAYLYHPAERWNIECP
jgi:hypothetical protein